MVYRFEAENVASFLRWLWTPWHVLVVDSITDIISEAQEVGNVHVQWCDCNNLSNPKTKHRSLSVRKFTSRLEMRQVFLQIEITETSTP